MKKLVFILILICSWNNLYSQQSLSKISKQLNEVILNKSNSDKILVWIYFSDKGTTLKKYFNNPNAIVSERSLKRRAKVKPKNKLIDYTDIPIAEEYIKRVEELGVKIKHKSKWLNAVSCYVEKSLLPEITEIRSVKKITKVKTFKRKKLPTPKNSQTLNKNSRLSFATAHTYNYGSSLTQNELINTVAVHDQGYSGKGILICLMDAGFDKLSHEVFQNMNIVAAWDFVNDDPDVENGTGQGEGSHGTSTLSLIGGFKEGQIIGTAFGADYLLAKTENTVSETPVEEDNWVAASEWADSIGADIFSTSLGYLDFDGTQDDYTFADMDGNTTVITVAADLAVGKGIVVFNSAGNEGYNASHNTLGAPADGDSVVAIGAVDANNQRAYFSSVGNTVDGRIKPDFMAMGSGTYAASNSSTTSYKSFSGTSASCPLAAGVPALMLEKDYSLTPMEIRNILRNTSNNTSTPNRLYGWGTINAIEAMDQIPSVLVQLKVFLQGAYNDTTHLMNVDLGTKIPLTSPYSENQRTINSIPSDIIDWVLVELRENATGNAVTSKSALIRKDGRIVADDGLTTEIKLDAPTGDYYIVIKHRNHLTVMSANKVALNTTSSTLYDFTQ